MKKKGMIRINDFLGAEGKPKRLKKLLLLLPAVVLPLNLLLGWYAKHERSKSKDAAAGQGINTNLPGAKLDNKAEGHENKLSLAEALREDSMQRVKHAGAFSEQTLQSLDWAGKSVPTKSTNTVSSGSSATQNAELLKKRLADLQQVISNPPPATTIHLFRPAPEPNDVEAQVARAEELVKARVRDHTVTASPDPELAQLNGMLDKVLAIQHPEKANSTDTDKKHGSQPSRDSIFKAIRAVVAGRQKALQGSAIRLRLVDSVALKGTVIPKGSYVYAHCQLMNQRLLLHVGTVRLGTSLVPVDLSVYDLDAMEGIPAPNAVTGEALRSGTDNAISDLQFVNTANGIGVQAANAGVEAAKSIFSKRVHVIRVKLRDGYPVLLRNEGH